jgi:hypothetical protein
MNEPHIFSLDGEWDFRLGDAATIKIIVPAAWETFTNDKLTDGPAFYRRKFELPADWAYDNTTVLECDAISFAARVLINGVLVGEHVGMWSRWHIDITSALRPAINEIEIEVWKPGSRYPLRQCLAGFLPDVCTTFGGIWQSIRLIQTTPTSLARFKQTKSPKFRLTYLRGVLDWGWNSKHIAPIRSENEVRQMIYIARALGFNLIKVCLYVPDGTFFRVCDQEQMPLWLELPLWQAEMTPALRELALREYRSLTLQLKHYSCIHIVSLGCELNEDTDLELLDALKQIGKSWKVKWLITNSGSAEAYASGQPFANAHANPVHDYHFYTDPHFFDALLDQFTRKYDEKPWLFGEFCDADTLRHFSKKPVWWMTEPVPNPLPDQIAMRDYKSRLSLAGVNDDAARLTTIARCQAMTIRKYIVEQTRKRHATGGYVITGWQDTPITTSGVVDDEGALKFEPQLWQQFNADSVLLIDRTRARQWQDGGDRPAYRDPFVFWADEPLQFKIILSNGAVRAIAANGRLSWQLTRRGSNGEVVIGQGGLIAPKCGAGKVCVLGEIFAPPQLNACDRAIHEYTLTVTFEAHDRQLTNCWQLLCVPRWVDMTSLATHRNLFNAITPDVIEFIAEGGCGVCWLTNPNPAFTRHLPFWREAIHVFEAQFHGVAPVSQKEETAFADMRFFSVATDFALSLDALNAHLQTLAPQHPIKISSVWRRFDARQLCWHEYAVEVRLGNGVLIVSTLRFAGGLGYQPTNLQSNPMGAWLLAHWLGMKGK